MLKDWRQEGKGTIENEMVGWHYRLTQWTWVWAKSRRRWRTGSPGVLQSMGSQRFGLSDWTIPVSSLYWRTDAFRLRVFSLNAYLLGNVLLFLFFLISLGALNPSGHAENIREMDLIPGSGRSPGGGMAAHSSILAGESPRQRSPAGYSPQGCKELDMTEVT